MHRKFYRSQTDEMLGGVCGGLGEYFDIDSNLVRLVFVVLSIANGIGILLYLAIWLIVPQAEAAKSSAKEQIRAGAEEIAAKARTAGDKIGRSSRRSNLPAGMLIGFALIVLGGILLFRNFGLWVSWLRFDLLWPVLLIAGGALLFWQRKRE